MATEYSGRHLSEGQLIDGEEDPRDYSKTTKRELWGWYFYAWACEPFIVSAVGTYVPILLEQLGRDNGFSVDDRSIPCAVNDDDFKLPGQKRSKCVVPFIGMWIDTSSLALYTFSLSVLVQTLVVISMSGAADRGKFRKKLLVSFALIGALSTTLYIIVGENYYFASILAIISNSAFGAVSVCGNAYLPVLVNNHPLNGSAKGSGPHSASDEPAGSGSGSGSGSSREHTPLLQQQDDFATPVESLQDKNLRARLSGQISGTGVAFGYLAAFIVQIVTMILIKTTGSTTFSLQLAAFIVGVWWLVFQGPVIALLKSRPGPPLPSSARVKADRQNHKLHIVWAYIRYGWRTIIATCKEARNMKDVAIFLAGWFLLSDAATTINSAAVLFARTELNMSAPSLAIIGILVVFSGMVGAITIPRYIQPRLDRFFNPQTNTSSPVNGIMFVICVAAVIPLYGLLGFYFEKIGLNHPWEMFVLAAWYGFALGGLNTVCRSVFSILIPKGKETTFFSLFAVTDKGSSIFGPFITGFIVDKTHNIRYTFYFLFAMMVAPLAVFYFLDVERGREEAKELETVEAVDI